MLQWNLCRHDGGKQKSGHAPKRQGSKISNIPWQHQWRHKARCHVASSHESFLSRCDIDLNAGVDTLQKHASDMIEVSHLNVTPPSWLTIGSSILLGTSMIMPTLVWRQISLLTPMTSLIYKYSHDILKASPIGHALSI